MPITYDIVRVRTTGPSTMARKDTEFGGTIGILTFIFLMPFVTIYLNMACTKTSCSLFHISEWPMKTKFINTDAVLMYFGWLLLQALLHVIVWGQLNYGVKMKNGTQLAYKCNGFSCLIITFILLTIGTYFGLPISFVSSNFLPLMMASIVFSFTISILLYARSWKLPKEEMAEEANGTFIQGFFLGRELNPRIYGFDLKFFFELRPGLIGWAILDICFLYEAHGRGNANTALWLVVFFHIFYVADALWHEEAILTTMDITRERLGFMLVFGNLSWVPFLYSLQARFLLHHDVSWSHLEFGIFIFLNGMGYLIFRLSNSQKNKFRKNPNDPSFTKLKTLATTSGKKLLISGWWGLSRHPNYLGDLIMSLTWSMVTGFHNIIPYFYPIYFLSLLLHRGQRDDKHCKEKYGKDWDKYCQLVPYKICPYVY